MPESRPSLAVEGVERRNAVRATGQAAWRLHSVAARENNAILFPGVPA